MSRLKTVLSIFTLFSAEAFAQNYNETLIHEDGFWQTKMFTETSVGDHCQVVTESNNKHYLSFIAFPDETIALSYRVPELDFGERWIDFDVQFSVDGSMQKFPASGQKSSIQIFPGVDNANFVEISALFAVGTRVEFLNKDGEIVSSFSLVGFEGAFEKITDCMAHLRSK